MKKITGRYVAFALAILVASVSGVFGLSVDSKPLDVMASSTDGVRAADHTNEFTTLVGAAGGQNADQCFVVCDIGACGIACIVNACCECEALMPDITTPHCWCQAGSDCES